MSRATSWAGFLVILVLAGCQQEGQTTVVVEFLLQGEGSVAARWLELGLRCSGEEELERTSYDLDLLGNDEEVTLAIEPRSQEVCNVELLAQLVPTVEDTSGGPSWVLASAREQIVFEPGAITRVTVILDTDACADADADGAVAGPPDCGALRDCDDLDQGIREGARESCDGQDEDCNGTVDDLSEEALAAACPSVPGERPPWQAGQGLCTYWAPICNGREVVCPALSLDDDCDLRFDTNCDGRVSCGCDSETVAMEIGCEPCHEAFCSGDDAVCRPLGIEDGRPGDPCLVPDLGECPGLWVCDRGSGTFRCEPAPEGSPEICNAEGTGLDEDCDGLTDFSDPDCEPLAALARSCSAFALQRVPIRDAGESEECAGFDGYSASCGSSILPVALPGDLTVVIDLGPGIVADAGRTSLSCCGCSLRSVSRPMLLDGLTVVSIDVEHRDGGPVLYTADNLLILVFDASHRVRGVEVAVARGLELAIPIDPTAGAVDPGFGLGNCLADCTEGNNLIDLIGIGL